MLCPLICLGTGNNSLELGIFVVVRLPLFAPPYRVTVQVLSYCKIVYFH